MDFVSRVWIDELDPSFLFLFPLPFSPLALSSHSSASTHLDREAKKVFEADAGTTALEARGPAGTEPSFIDEDGEGAETEEEEELRT